MEVIYTGLRQTPAQIAEAALQEDVEVVGLSSLSGAHEELFPKVVDELKARGMDDVLIIAGGVIPPQDVERLQQMGIHRIFTPGTPIEEIVSHIQEAVQRIRGEDGASLADGD